MHVLRCTDDISNILFICETRLKGLTDPLCELGEKQVQALTLIRHS